MYWERVKKDVIDFGDRALIQALKKRNKLDTVRLSNVQAFVDYEIFSIYSAIAYGLNDRTAIKKICSLKDSGASFYYGCREWSRWFKNVDVEPFAQIFNLWESKNWFLALSEAVEQDGNTQFLNAILKLHTPEGNAVVNPLENGSELLRKTCINGNREAFDILFFISDFRGGRDRCFIAAVYNKNMDLAHEILSHCIGGNGLEILRANVTRWVTQEVETPQDQQRADVMFAMIEKFAIENALENINQGAFQRVRKM